MILALAPLLLAATAGSRPFPEERHLLDRRLETLRRILPDRADPPADAALVKQLAEGIEIAGLDAIARPPAESGTRGDVIVEVSGTARYADLERFFRQVALSPRLIDVESLTLTGTPGDLVRLAAVLRLPYRPAKTPLPAPPEGMRSRVGGLPRGIADAYLRDQALALAKTEAITTLRRARRNPRLFLSELAAIVRDRPVVVTYASLEDEFLVRGMAVGEGSMRSLQSRFERGFFRVSEFLMARRGACHNFEVKGRSPVVGVEAELPLPTEDPFDQDEAPCRVDRDTGRSIVLKGPDAKKPGKGPLTLRLRDVDLADAFQVLHLLTSQGFLVDGDVTGRVSMELSRVTLEETLAALEKQGFKVSPPGPVRRVSLARGPAPRSLPGTGGQPAASFLLKRADVRDVLAVMTEADPSLAALGPQGFLGRISLWATDVALADLRAAVLDATGLIEWTEEGRRILGRNPRSDEPVFPVAGAPPPDQRLILRARDLAVLEFELAGVAAIEDRWMAFAYSPTGALNVYRPGDRLADASFKSVESTDVVLETDEGTLQLAVPPVK